MSTSFGDLVTGTWREGRLFSVLLELTYRCNLDCAFCYNDVALRGTPLATERYEALFDELAEMGVFSLVLSGGEPLAHADFFRLGARARALGFVVRVKSNGHALRDELARRLRDEVDPFVVEVSLHGATAAVHDRQTRVPGSHARLLANLGAMTALGLRVQLVSTLTSWNEEEVEAMFALADGLGLPLRFDTQVTPRDDGDRSPLALAASDAGLRRLGRALAARAASATQPDCSPAPAAVEPAAAPHCGAGSAAIAVDPYGTVYPCVQWRRPLGNLHRQTVREIWQHNAALSEVRRLAHAARDVVAAAGGSEAGLDFCPGNAESMAGDPLRVDPESVRRGGLVREGFDAGRSRRSLPVVR